MVDTLERSATHQGLGGGEQFQLVSTLRERDLGLPLGPDEPVYRKLWNNHDGSIPVEADNSAANSVAQNPPTTNEAAKAQISSLIRAHGVDSFEVSEALAGEAGKLLTQDEYIRFITKTENQRREAKAKAERTQIADQRAQERELIDTTGIDHLWPTEDLRVADNREQNRGHRSRVARAVLKSAGVQFVTLLTPRSVLRRRTAQLGPAPVESDLRQADEQLLQPDRARREVVATALRSAGVRAFGKLRPGRNRNNQSAATEVVTENGANESGDSHTGTVLIEVQAPNGNHVVRRRLNEVGPDAVVVSPDKILDLLGIRDSELEEPHESQEPEINSDDNVLGLNFRVPGHESGNRISAAEHNRRLRAALYAGVSAVGTMLASGLLIF